MAMARGGLETGVTSDINVTPMADIMLVLLIIFMITTPLLTDPLFINKPKAVNAQEAPEVEGKEATTVAIDRMQQVYINREPVPLEQVVERLAERAALAPEKPLFIKSDVAVPYGTVVDIINKARDAEIERIGLLVDRIRIREGG
jgi:biopolymer transport protein ExbD